MNVYNVHVVDNGDFYMNTCKFVVLAAMVFFSAEELFAQNPVYPFHPKEKKLIVFQAYNYEDWVDDVALNLDSMQADRPYVDGLVFRASSDFAFDNVVWTESSMRFTDLATISTKTTTFKENFILVNAISYYANPDFFNDALWTTIISNAQLMGKAVATAGCKGIMFDAEFYTGGQTYSPWWYTVPADNPNHQGTPPYAGAGITFDQAKAKARQRGKEYVQALQVYMPKITIMTTCLYGSAWHYCSGNIANLSSSQYALLPAFADGMLEALNADSVLVDGNEGSYYCSDTTNYVQDNVHGSNYNLIRLSASNVCDPALLPKWNLQGQVAMAPFMDYCYNIYSPQTWNTPTYQSKWMKHNVYNSLLATDQYAWVYVESMNFWTGENQPFGVDVFADVNDAVTTFRNGTALGYDMYNATDSGASQFISTPIVAITSPADNTMIAPGNVTINATVSPNTSIDRVEFYANSLKIGEVSTSPYSITTSFLIADYTIYARVFKTDGTHATSAPITLLALPSPWKSRDIGSPGAAGSAVYGNGTFTVTGSGGDIWDTSDQFRYVYQTASGDCQITARVASLQNVNAWSKAGVMVRETLNANSTFAMMVMTASNGACFQYRTSAGGNCGLGQSAGKAAPYWVRVKRAGNTFTGYMSPDGNTWTPVGAPQTITMGASVYIGLPVTSHNNSALCTAAMDNVTATP